MDPALTFQELGFSSVERDEVLERVRAALLERGLDADFAARLARCDKLFGISGMTPQLLAIAVRMLHEAHVYPVRRGGRGRPSEPMRGTLVGFYQIFYGGSLKLERGEAHRRTAAICSAFFQEPINAATVRLRLSALRARWRKLIRGGRWPRGEYPVV